jgi:hypothetical protein
MIFNVLSFDFGILHALNVVPDLDQFTPKDYRTLMGPQRTHEQTARLPPATPDAEISTT